MTKHNNMPARTSQAIAAKYQKETPAHVLDVALDRAIDAAAASPLPKAFMYECGPYIPAAHNGVEADLASEGDCPPSRSNFGYTLQKSPPPCSECADGEHAWFEVEKPADGRSGYHTQVCTQCGHCWDFDTSD